jgi:hypothetical protein
VILDTNALFMPFQFGINLDAELKRLFGVYTYVIPAPVLDEVRNLVERGERHAGAAHRLAEHLSRSAVVFPSDLPADDAVISAAVGTGGSILTTDSELRKRARSRGIRVVYLRGRSHLEADPPA